MTTPRTTTRTTPRRQPRDPFLIGELLVPPGRSATGELPISRLVTGTQISLPIQIVHGRKPGRTVWLSAAVHGDEIGGVEIIRRVTKSLDARAMSGTVIAVPIVNVHGFLHGDRYLPDRRDLNRAFPGSPNGSLAARIANLFMREIVTRCDVGIDLHSGSDHRTNLPHVRGDLDDPTTRKLAEAFGASIMVHARLRDGSLRAAATENGATMLLYEGGEAWRFDTAALDVGVRGIRRVLSELDMIDADPDDEREIPMESRRTSWVRARRSGLVLLQTELGAEVVRGQLLGVIHDSVGKRLSRITATTSGVVIGHIQHPLVHQGDAIANIAEITRESDHDINEGPHSMQDAPPHDESPSRPA